MLGHQIDNINLEKKEHIDKKMLNLENKLCQYELLENTKCDSIEE